MRVLKTRVMDGPNTWSEYRHHLIEIKLDLEDLEDRPTDTIRGFAARLEFLIPSLYTHHCSEGREGGFFKRVERGTWMGHVIEHIALELQTLAGMDCGFGRTRSADDRGVYYVVYAYRNEEAGLYAGEAAIRIAEALISGRRYDIDKDIRALKKLAGRSLVRN